MTRQRSIDAWWRSLDGDRRRSVLRVAAGDPLPEGIALELQRVGVQVPRVSVSWDVDGAIDRCTVFVQPRALTDYLEVVRSAASASA